MRKYDWTPLLRLNREFHLKVFSLSASRPILEEVKRLWAVADTFIATKMAYEGARRRTVEENDLLPGGTRPAALPADDGNFVSVQPTHLEFPSFA